MYDKILITKCSSHTNKFPNNIEQGAKSHENQTNHPDNYRKKKEYDCLYGVMVYRQEMDNIGKKTIANIIFNALIVFPSQKVMS